VEVSLYVAWLDGEGPAVALHGLLVLPESLQRIAEIVEAFGVARGQAYRLLECRPCLAQASRDGEEIAAVVVRLPRAWFECQHAVVAGMRLLVAAEIAQRGAAVVDGAEMPGSERERRIVAGQRLLRASELLQDVRAVVVDLGVARRQRQGLLEARERLGAAFEPAQGGAAQVVGAGPVAAEPQDLLAPAEHLLVAAELVEDDGVIEEHARRAGIDGEGRAEAPVGLGVAPAVEGKHGQQMQSVGLLGVALEHQAAELRR